jgi:hypothetical protein
MALCKCRDCGVSLTDDNWQLSRRNTRNYICKPCNREYAREYRYNHGGKSMSENNTCASFLGVHVAERVLFHVFENVEPMPLNHKGYDFICGKGFAIDVKSSCRCIRANRRPGWQFHIRKNTIADYFLCLAFNNRKSLNVERLWLIPGTDVNDKQGISISETKIKKWSRYELTEKLDHVISCCDTLHNIHR